MKRYELEVGNTNHFLKATDEAAARIEAQEIVDYETTNPERKQYRAQSEFSIYAVLREVTDLQSYEIFTPPV